MSRNFTFFSRSVTEGHPDKLCDAISDAIVGEYLRQDPTSVVSAECAVSNAILFVAVRFASDGTVDVPNTARRVVRDVGYDETQEFDPQTCTIVTSVAELPGLESRRHATPLETPVTDQATVFGYACSQTPSLMPLPIFLAHRLARRLSEVRRDGSLPYLAPEAKTQVGIEFEDRRPKRVYSVHLIASQRRAGDPPLEALRQDLLEHVGEPVFGDTEIGLDPTTRIDVNMGGAIVGGGPAVHSGLTGRKTHVDTYGEYARTSGMALSGKDPSRAGRAGVYAARYLAKHVVASGLARECEVQLSYSLGSTAPIGVQVETFGTGRTPDDDIANGLEEVFDLRLGAILDRLRLRELPAEFDNGFYRTLAVYGHVGREDLDLPWERLDQVPDLLEATAKEVT